MQPLKEDIERMRGKQENLAFWQRRRRFLTVHWNKFPREDLVSLSYCYSSVMVYSCRYPQAMMDKLYGLALEVADNLHKEESMALPREIRRKWNEAMTEPETLGQIELYKMEEETGESADDEGDTMDVAGYTEQGQPNMEEKAIKDLDEKEQTPLINQSSQKLLPENLSKVPYPSDEVLPLACNGPEQKVLNNQLKSPPLCGLNNQTNTPLKSRAAVITSNQLPKEESEHHHLASCEPQLSLLQQQKSYLQKSSQKSQHTSALDVKEKHHNRKSNVLLGTGRSHLSEVERSPGVKERHHQMHSDINKLKQFYNSTSYKDVRYKKNEPMPSECPHPPPTKACAVEQMPEVQRDGEHLGKRGSPSTANVLKKKHNLLTKKVEHCEKISTTKTSVLRKSKQEDFGRKDKCGTSQEQTTPYDKAIVHERREHGTCHKSVSTRSHVVGKDDTITNIKSENKRKGVRELSTSKCVTLHSQGQTGGAFYRKEGIQTHVQGQPGNGFFKKEGTQYYGQSQGGFYTKEGAQTLTKGNYPSSKSVQNLAASASSGDIKQRKASDNTEGAQKKSRVIYPSHSSKSSSSFTRNKMDAKNGEKIVKPVQSNFSKSHLPKSQESVEKPVQSNFSKSHHPKSQESVEKPRWAEHGARSLHGPTAYKSNKFPLKNFFQGLFQKARNSFDC